MTQFDDQYGRLPPHSIESEQCLLASMMLQRDCIGEVLQVTGQTDLFQEDHRIIFDILVSLYESNSPVDAVIVREELIRRGLLEEVGGSAYLGQLLSAVPSAAHVLKYAETVANKATLRRLIEAANATLRDAYGPYGDLKPIIESFEQRAFSIAEKKIRGGLVHAGDTAYQVYENLADQKTRGLETGFSEVDDMLNGLQKSELIIIAGRPSMGKTAITMNIVEELALYQKRRGAVFSLEMSKEALVQRMMCSMMGLDSQRVRKGMIGAEAYEALAKAARQIGMGKLWLDDTPGATILDLRAKCRRAHREEPLQWVMVDYLQLMEGDGENRQESISKISRGLKALGRELNVPVIALSQLNRASESRDGHRPRMSDLRESGSIEQDADVVILLHREDYFKQFDPDFQPDNIAEIIIAKQRNGPTGTVKLTYDQRSTRFLNMSAAQNIAVM